AVADRAQQCTPGQGAMRNVKHHRKTHCGNGRQRHVLHQRQQKIDYAHPRSPHNVIAITTPTQVARVSRLAIAQRASPVLIWPLNMSATALISGKPGTSSSTLAA